MGVEATHILAVNLPKPPVVVAFDEAGNTGDNLLDPKQPIFALASVHIDQGEADALVANALPLGRKELHFADLRGSSVGRRAVLNILRSDLVNEASCRVTPTHKPFAVAARLFDYVIEPTYFERNIDIYDDGMHISMANVFFRRGPLACGGVLWDQMLTTFTSLVREQTDLALDAFMASHAACVDVSQDELLDPMLTAVPARDEVWQRIHIDQPQGVGPRDLLDPIATSLVENCMTWPERLQTSVIVLHDENQVIHRWRPLLNSLAGANAADVAGPYWGPRMPLPLKIADIRLVRSHDSTPVQIADIIAGSAVTWLTEQQQPDGRWEQFSREIEAVGVPALIENEVWPLPLDGRLGRFSP